MKNNEIISRCGDSIDGTWVIIKILRKYADTPCSKLAGRSMLPRTHSHFPFHVTPSFSDAVLGRTILDFSKIWFLNASSINVDYHVWVLSKSQNYFLSRYSQFVRWVISTFFVIFFKLFKKGFGIKIRLKSFDWFLAFSATFIKRVASTF